LLGGILWAPGSGKATAELVLTGKAGNVNLDAFAVDRFDTAEMMKNKKKRGRAKNGQAIGEQW
jgi:hypothetical protein